MKKQKEIFAALLIEDELAIVMATKAAKLVELLGEDRITIMRRFDDGEFFWVLPHNVKSQENKPICLRKQDVNICYRTFDFTVGVQNEQVILPERFTYRRGAPCSDWDVYRFDEYGETWSFDKQDLAKAIVN